MKMKSKLLTTLEMSSYWISNFSIALINVCMATHRLWWTTRTKFLLSSSEKPQPWIILICLINVDFPDSPAPITHFTLNWVHCLIHIFYRYEMLGNSECDSYRWSRNIILPLQTENTQYFHLTVIINLPNKSSLNSFLKFFSSSMRILSISSLIFFLALASGDRQQQQIMLMAILPKSNFVSHDLVTVPYAFKVAFLHTKTFHLIHQETGR